MSSLAVIAVLPGLFEEPDWTSLGLVSAIVGCFLIGNAILFEHPRRLVERHFGREHSGRLTSIREYIFNRVQTTLGFTFLMGGFGLQLVGRYRPFITAGEPPLSVAWVGLFVIVAVTLLLTAWWYSQKAFRRYVRRYLRENPPDLEGDPALAREIGDLFGIESFGDDSLEAYVARLRAKTGLVTQRSRSMLPGRGSDQDESEGLATRS